MALLDRPFAAVYDRLMAVVEGRWLGAARHSLLQGLTEGLTEGLTGRVLEIGAGTGANFPHYPPGVRVTALDPSPHFIRRARSKLAGAAAEIGLLRADGQDLPFKDNSFDAAVATLVFCTIPDPARALAQVRRVTRPGAPLLLIEHIQAATPGKRLLQNLWNPCQRVIAGGCNVNRDTETTVRAAGFRVEEVRLLALELGLSPQILLRAANAKPASFLDSATP
jgi:ubiquinone/menaquinone biosynthesis C-methylase UbiE